MSVIGLRVGPFEIVESATVPEPGDWYRAHRTGLTRRQPNEVLVKLLAPDAPDSERAALQSEFDNLRAMEDPRVPEAVALYEGIGALAIAAPDGITLDDVVDARSRGSIAMTPATLLDLALEIAETLQHAHHRSRHHGHLSGSNIRLSTAGKLHIFGFATGPFATPSLEWMAPERARGEPASPATDQWSLAAVLAGLISGRAPWAGMDEGAVKNGDLESLIEPIERQWPALSRLFRRMLDPDPANRYPSMQPVRQELLALARKAGGTSEKRDLGKLMARRVGRTVAPDSDVPAEFTTHTAPPEAPPVDFAEDAGGTEATEASDAPPDTAAETVHDPHAAPETVEEMEPPPPPRREPAAADPVPVAERVEGHVDRGTPLPMERIHAVQPDLASEEVPEARREDDGLDLPGPAASGGLGLAEPVLLQSIVPKVDSEEDVTDAPTERYDPAKLRELEDLEDLPPPKPSNPPLTADPPVDPTLAADEESSDAGLPPDELARALAVDAGAAFGGEGPTAVPFTDVDEAPSSVEPAPRPAPIPAPTPRPPQTRAPTPRPAMHAEPAFEEVQEAVRQQPVHAPEPSSIQRFAPLLVLVMVVLMLGFIAMAVW